MNKPLPELPPNKTHRGLKHIQSTVNWATLSIDAQAHLRTFILYALEEERDTLPQDEWEEWASAVEHGLTELGERISLGGWLVGVRRTKLKRIQEKEERCLAKLSQSACGPRRPQTRHPLRRAGQSLARRCSRAPYLSRSSSLAGHLGGRGQLLWSDG